MIRLQNLRKDFNGITLFHDINMTVNEGDVVALIGPSGSGKSVLLRSMMRLEEPDYGGIYLDDMEITNPDCDIAAVRERIGMVFQYFNLFSHMTVVENVMSGLVHVQKMAPQKAFDEAMKVIQSVGLTDKAFFYPDNLSGGQKQRAAIARTLAQKPEIILLDEPTSALDPMYTGEVAAVIRMLAAQGHTMVIVTHEMNLVRDVCNRVIFLKDGTICEEGTPEKIFEHAENAETRRFVRELRVLEFDVRSRDFDFIGSQTTVSEFSFRNGIPSRLKDRLLAIMEELYQMVIIQPKEDNIMHITFEYNRNETSLDGEVMFSGPLVDPDDPHYFISWPIIEHRASEIKVNAIDEDGFTNRLEISIHD